jgi:hypothetical protein
MRPHPLFRSFIEAATRRRAMVAASRNETPATASLSG